jgi:S-adenosylmethionine hydrolase
MATIALLTDFGTRDPFVGVMKGVIASIAPRTTVVDLTHAIDRQDVRGAAIALWTSHRFFPRGTVFVCVVDPGVGTSRRTIAARAHGNIFVAPDNGLLTRVLDDDRRAVVRSIERRAWMLPEISATFHGRDVFAPVGAHLSKGASLARFAKVGPLVDRWKRLEIPNAERRGTRIVGEIIGRDVFGNATTNIPGAWTRLGDAVSVRGKTIARVARAYGDVPLGAAVVVTASASLLEISINGGDACAKLRLKVGLRVEIPR